jgi:intraflagellar transport protein 52
LFDLDDHFSNQKTKLQQLTAKCTDEDLEYYLQECGKILGIMDRLGPERQDGRNVLNHVFKNIVNWRKNGQ